MVRRSIFINELSTEAPFKTPKDAVEGMGVFVQTIVRAERAGLNGGLACLDDIKGMKLCPDYANYTLYSWLDDDGVDHDVKNRFLISATSAPNPFNFSYYQFCSPDEELEVQYDGRCAIVFGFALLVDGMCASIDSSSWGVSYVDLHVFRLKIDDEEVLTEEVQRVRHASTPEHVVEHADWILNEIAFRPQSGEDIWGMRDRVFCEVTLCPSVEDQLQYFNGNLLDIYKIETILRDLCRVASGWRSGAFPEEELRFKVSGEGETAKQDPKCVAQRTSVCGARGDHVFTRHIRINKGDRLYFEAFAPGEVYVGYVGVHPRSKKFK